VSESVVELVRAAVELVVHRAERRRVDRLHHVLEQVIGARRRLRVHLQRLAESGRGVLGRRLVLGRRPHREPSGRLLVREQGIELVVDPAGDLRAHAAEVAGFFAYVFRW